jgi:hypothetical protein
MAAKQRFGVAGVVHFFATLIAEFGFTSNQKTEIDYRKKYSLFSSVSVPQSGP